MADRFDLLADLIQNAARTFVRSKGRIPQSAEETVEWLLEFNKHEGKMLESVMANYHEHMRLCTTNRIIVPNPLK